jgi:energy-coupling factor transporter ATP-binding protein EcfA2
MKKIKSISIDKIKGIDSKTFDLELIPNKPSILVGPNGFGKSSLTAAFNKLNGNGIKLDKDTFYQNDETNKPKLSVIIENDNGTQTNLIAEENLNTIKNEFDIFVINNLLVPRHKKQTFAGTTVVSSSIEVAPITLIDNIQSKKSIDYSPTASRIDFGKNGKILPNITALLSNQQFIRELYRIDLSKYERAKIRSAITKFVDSINSFSGKVNEIFVSGVVLLPELKQKGNLEEIVSLLSKHNSELTDEVEKYCTAIQILEVYRKDKKRFIETVKYFDYLNEK